MAIEIIDCVQGTEEWITARLGIPTASCFSDVMAGGAGKVRSQYMRKLCGEIIAGTPADYYKNAAMEHGNQVEPELRSLYELITGQEVTQVGFIRNGRVGASPDGLIGTDGMVEIKRQGFDGLINRLLFEVGDIHEAQLQGQLWVCEREWIELAVGYPKMPLYRKRFKRDNNYIARLKVGVECFIEELDTMVEEVRKRFGR